MASNQYDRLKILGKRRAGENEKGGDEEEQREIEELEAELADMARKILDYRKSVPEKLVKAFGTNLVAQRPVVLPQIEASAAPEVNTTEEAEISENTKKINEKLSILREKSQRNVSAIPTVLNRMNECIARINKVEQFNVVNIHPVFKRKK